MTAAVQEDNKRAPLTQEHKDAMALGRKQGRVVAAYLDRLSENKPRRGRKRTVESITKRLAAIEKELASASMLKSLALLQEKERLSSEKANFEDKKTLADLEKEFVKVAKEYADRKGISYTIFRDVGVPPETLKKAGIAR